MNLPLLLTYRLQLLGEMAAEISWVYIENCVSGTRFEELCSKCI